MPRHAGPRPTRSLRPIRATMLASGVAVAATGIAVSSGVAVTDNAPRDTAAAALVSQHGESAPSVEALPSVSLEAGRAALPLPHVAAAIADRARAVSRSVERTAVAPAKQRALSQASGGQLSQTEHLATGDPRSIARALLPRFGFGSDQFSCLDEIYSQESGWNVHADNPSSSAYGIPQALPGSKMASAGSDWATNPVTQITWGLGYIRDRYGSPCSAWGFKQGHGWY